jgi:hypothetical protein
MHLAPIPGSGAATGCTVSHYRHHFSTSFLPWSKKYFCQTLPRVLLTPKWPPYGPLCSSVSISFTVLRGRTIWVIFDRPSADSQWRSTVPSLMVRDFHWAHQLLYVGLRSAMSFHSGRCPVSTSSRMEPMSWSFSCPVLRAPESQPAAATAAVSCSCLMSAPLLYFVAWVHSSCRGGSEKSSTLFCFRPWGCSEVKFHSCRRRIQRAVCPSGFLNLMCLVNAEWSVRKCNSCP